MILKILQELFTSVLDHNLLFASDYKTINHEIWIWSKKANLSISDRYKYVVVSHKIFLNLTLGIDQWVKCQMRNSIYEKFNI